MLSLRGLHLQVIVDSVNLNNITFHFQQNYPFVFDTIHRLNLHISVLNLHIMEEREVGFSFKIK